MQIVLVLDSNMLLSPGYLHFSRWNSLIFPEFLTIFQTHLNDKYFFLKWPPLNTQCVYQQKAHIERLSIIKIHSAVKNKGDENIVSAKYKKYCVIKIPWFFLDFWKKHNLPDFSLTGKILFNLPWFPEAACTLFYEWTILLQSSFCDAQRGLHMINKNKNSKINLLLPFHCIMFRIWLKLSLIWVFVTKGKLSVSVSHLLETFQRCLRILLL